MLTIRQEQLHTLARVHWEPFLLETAQQLREQRSELVRHLDAEALHARLIGVVELACEGGIRMESHVRNLAVVMLEKDLDPDKPEMRARLAAILARPGVTTLGKVQTVSRLSANVE